MSTSGRVSGDGLALHPRCFFPLTRRVIEHSPTWLVEHKVEVLLCAGHVRGGVRVQAALEAETPARVPRKTQIETSLDPVGPLLHVQGLAVVMIVLQSVSALQRLSPFVVPSVNVQSLGRGRHTQTDRLYRMVFICAKHMHQAFAGHVS